MSLSKMGEALLEDGPAATASAALVTEAWRASSVLAHVTGGLSYGPYANEILSELRDIHTDLQGVHNALQPLRSLDATITEWLLLLPKDVTTEVDIRTISTQLLPLWITLQQLLRVPSVAIRTSTFGDTTLPARVQGLESAAPAAPPPPAHE